MPQINTIIITDFDGTTTGLSGGKLVYSPFYQSLLVGGQGDYKQTPLLGEAELQAKFNAEFDGKRDDPRLMSRAAEAYYRRVLEEESCALCINTKNRADYIIAMLRYLNFTEEQIAKITIKDKSWKGSVTSDYLSEIADQVSDRPTIIILDDSPVDHDAMVSAAEAHALTTQHHATIKSYNANAGNFDSIWSTLSSRLGDSPDTIASYDVSNLQPLERPKKTLISYAFALKALRAVSLLGIGLAITAIIVGASIMSGGAVAAGLLIGAGIVGGALSSYGLFNSHQKISHLEEPEASAAVLSW